MENLFIHLQDFIAKSIVEKERAPKFCPLFIVTKWSIEFAYCLVNEDFLQW